MSLSEIPSFQFHSQTLQHLLILHPPPPFPPPLLLGFPPPPPFSSISASSLSLSPSPRSLPLPFSLGIFWGQGTITPFSFESSNGQVWYKAENIDCLLKP